MIKIDNFKFNNARELCDKIAELTNKEPIGADFKMNDFIKELYYNINLNVMYGDVAHGRDTAIKHNLINKTYNKKDVPTVKIDTYRFTPEAKYCPECGKNNNKVDMAGVILKANLYDSKKNYDVYSERQRLDLRIDSITCLDCGHEHNIEDIKIIFGGLMETLGDVFIDENKITLSSKYMLDELCPNTEKNRNKGFFYHEGYSRLTFNLETGFSYTTNKGHAYRQFDEVWKRRNGYRTKAPVMFNSTYTTFDGSERLLNRIAFSKAYKEVSQLSKKEIIDFNIEKRAREIELELTKQITDVMYDKIQANVNYTIPRVNHYNDYDDITVSELRKYNRFYNINPFDKTYEYLRDNELAYNKIKRDEICLLHGFAEMNKVKLGKKAKKLVVINKDNYNFNMFTTLVLSCFKNPDNIHKIIKTYLEYGSRFSPYMAISSYREAYKLWSNYRDENYLVNEFMKDLIYKINKTDIFSPSYLTQNTNNNKDNKIKYMRDALYLIRQIQRDLGDIDIKSIVDFKNEKQFHDDLSKYMNSDSYQDMVNAEKDKRIFELEDEVLALEEPENNILIARTHGELSRIGSKMGICVGGYSSSVESKHCRIAYIRDNDTHNYKCCIELKPIFEEVSKKLKITGYSIVQAKLKYNERACKDEYIYSLINNWAKKNNIKIYTYDMEL